MRNPARLAFLLTGLLGGALHAQDGYVFSTLAGRAGSSGSTDGSVTNARFSSPRGVARGWDGSILVVDSDNFTIRRIASGGVSTIAGQPMQPGDVNGAPLAARFGGSYFTLIPPSIVQLRSFGPSAAALRGDGTLVIVDGAGPTLRTLTSVQVATLAGAAQITMPSLSLGPPIVIPPAPATSSVDGTGTAAKFKSPTHVAVDPDGVIYIADSNANTIRRIEGEEVTTYAGATDVAGAIDGPRLSARFSGPAGLACDPAGNLWVVDSNNYLVRRISRDGIVTTIAGGTGAAGTADGRGGEARFGGRPLQPDLPAEIRAQFTAGALPLLTGPTAAASRRDGSIVVSDTISHTLRLITPAGDVHTIGGAAGSAGSTDGPGPAARFSRPHGLAFDAEGNLYVADTDNHVIRKGTPAFRPQFAAHPVSQPLTPGATLTLAATLVANALPVTLQWWKDGVALAGASQATLVLTDPGPGQAGSYTLVATNALGSTTSNAAVVGLAPPPVIVAAPARTEVRGGEAFQLGVSVSGAGPFTYQWQKDGRPIPGATSATFTVTAAQAGDAGSYVVVVANPGGTVTSPAASVTVDTARIANLSIRTALDAGTPMLTVGFVVAGGDKVLLARAVGPTLQQFGLATALADPQIAIFSGTSRVGFNDNWSATTNPLEVAAAAAGAGAFPLAAGTLDAAHLSSYSAGGYSAQVTGAAEGRGVVLVELYDSSPAAAARLINVSARAQVGTGDDLLVAGFVLTGNRRKTLLIRAVGPTLATFGVERVLADPKLEIFATGQTAPVAANDDWAGDPALSAAFAARGAFPFAGPAAKDAALLVTLEPGAYSAQVSGVAGTTGEALVEIYEVP